MLQIPLLDLLFYDRENQLTDIFGIICYEFLFFL
jgi:hypothetical protein